MNRKRCFGNSQDVVNLKLVCSNLSPRKNWISHFSFNLKYGGKHSPDLESDFPKFSRYNIIDSVSSSGNS